MRVSGFSTGDFGFIVYIIGVVLDFLRHVLGYFKSRASSNGGILYEFDVVVESLRFGCNFFVGHCISLYGYCICITLA